MRWTKYKPKPGGIQSARSIRSHLDQRFPKSSGITEHVLPIWFSHSASHDLEVWKAHHLQQELPTEGCLRTVPGEESGGAGVEIYR